MADKRANSKGIYRPPAKRGGQGHEQTKNNQRRAKANAASTKSQLTHFLSIPLGHIPELRTKVSSFTSALLSSNPPIPGLDQSIVIPARRLHLTLGVMPLTDGPETAMSSRSSSSAFTQSKTLQDAIALLENIKPNIITALQGQPLRVPLSALDIMPPVQNNPERAHICFLAPDTMSADARRLWDVGRIVNTEFKQAGFLGDLRPLKLHCTIISTTYRQPKPKRMGSFGRRMIPFSYLAVFASQALSGILSDRTGSPDVESIISSEACAASLMPSVPQIPTNGNFLTQAFTAQVNLGTYEVNEIQICEMSSKGPEGEYVCVGKINL